jgi:hypothetical protein
MSASLSENLHGDRRFPDLRVVARVVRAYGARIRYHLRDVCQVVSGCIKEVMTMRQG